MSEASDRDRHYRALGLSPGASLQEIEESWRLRSAEFHPDKFPAARKDWATGKAQEINHARDELRRWLREPRDAAPAGPAYQPHVMRVPPEAEAEPLNPPAAIGFQRTAVLGSREAAGPDEAQAAAPGRRAVLSYSAAALVALLVLAGGSAALLRDSGGAAAVPASEPPRPMAADLPDPHKDSLSDDAPAPRSADHIAAAVPAAGAAPGRAEALSTAKPPGAPEPSDRNTTPAAADPHSAASILFPAAATDRDWRAADAMPPQPSAASVENDAAQAGAPPATSGPPFSAMGADQAARGRRDPLVLTAMQACKRDKQRFCAGVKPGGGRLAKCARQHFHELSSGCSRALLALRDARRGHANSPSAQR